MAYLEFLTGPNQGTILELKGDTHIGRVDDNTLCLPDTQVSRHHAIIQERDGRYHVMDQGSANGTWLNLNRLMANILTALQDQDALIVGTSRIVFHGPVGKHALANLPKDEPPPFRPDAPPTATSITVIINRDATAAPAIAATISPAAALANQLQKADAADDPAILTELLQRLKAREALMTELESLPTQHLLLSRAMDVILAVVPQAEHAAILLQLDPGQELQPALWREMSTVTRVGPSEFMMHQQVLDLVLAQRQSVLANEFLRGLGAKPEAPVVVRALMCIPLLHQDEVLGLLLLDTYAGPFFTAADLLRVTDIAALLTLGLRRLLATKAACAEAASRAKLLRYLSTDLARDVLDGRVPLELSAKTGRAAILCGEFAGLNRLLAGSKGPDVLDCLTSLQEQLRQAVHRHRGAFAHVGAESFRAVWNVVLGDDDPDGNAAHAAFGAQVALWQYNLAQQQRQLTEFAMGTAVVGGSCLSGNIGGDDALEFVTIGELQLFARHAATRSGRQQILISQPLWDSLASRAFVVRLPGLAVPGFNQAVTFFSLRGLRIDAERIALFIPVLMHAVTDTLGTGIPGILTQAIGKWPEYSLRLLTAAPVPAGSELTLETDLCELGTRHRIRGTITATQELPPTRPGGCTCSMSTLENTRLAPELATLMRIGTITPSTQTWEEMKHPWRT